MPRGGARPGAGRKKGVKEKHTLEKEEARRLLREQVLAEMGPMTASQIATAKGIKYLVARAKKGGKFVHLNEELYNTIVSGGDTEHELIEVWAEKPSTQAYTDLMNRALDKP